MDIAYLVANLNDSVLVTLTARDPATGEEHDEEVKIYHAPYHAWTLWELHRVERGTDGVPAEVPKVTRELRALNVFSDQFSDGLLTREIDSISRLPLSVQEMLAGKIYAALNRRAAEIATYGPWSDEEEKQADVITDEVHA